jgi:uncharacterized protein (TIGR02147 family)
VNRSIFQFTDYKEFLKERIQKMPRGGHGQYRKISTFLGVNSTMISQILSGPKHFTSEQTLLTAEYFGLDHSEVDYLLTLVQFERAGTHKLKKFHQKKIEQFQAKAQKAKTRIGAKKELIRVEQATFYSDYTYSAVRLLTSIPGKFQDAETIAKHLNIPREHVLNLINFLLNAGLILEKNGGWEIGPSKTHIGSDSPFVSRHHSNWRLLAMQKHPRLLENELAFTSPLTISRKDFKLVKNRILELIQELGKIIDKTDPEQLACLNIDWFVV